MDLSAKSAYMGAYIDGTRGFMGNPKKFTEDGLLLRGNGTLHLEDGRLRFKYMGIKRELVISFEQMTGVDIADKHMHRKVLGHKVLVVKWRHKGLVLGAGESGWPEWE